MAQVIQRQFERLFAPRARRVSIDWPGTPGWAQAPRTLFSGDTVHLFARFPAMPAGDVTLRMELDNGQTLSPSVTIRPRPVTATPSDLARLGAVAELGELTDDGARTALALRYQLLCGETAYLVVDSVSAQGDGLPRLRTVPTMLAAGWGGSARMRDYDRSVSHPEVMAERSILWSDSEEPIPSLLSDVQSRLLQRGLQRRCSVGNGAGNPLGRSGGSTVSYRLSRLADSAIGTWPTTLDELSQLGLSPALRKALETVIAAGWEKSAVATLWLARLLKDGQELGLSRQAQRRIRLSLKALPAEIDRVALELAIDVALTRALSAEHRQG